MCVLQQTLKPISLLTSLGPLITTEVEMVLSGYHKISGAGVRCIMGMSSSATGAGGPFSQGTLIFLHSCLQYDQPQLTIFTAIISLCPVSVLFMLCFKYATPQCWSDVAYLLSAVVATSLQTLHEDHTPGFLISTALGPRCMALTSVAQCRIQGPH